MGKGKKASRTTVGTKKHANEVQVRGKRIPMESRSIPHRHLKFYAANPRVYSVLRSVGVDPTQEEIETHLRDMEHVRELTQDIKRHGGLIDALVVLDGSLEVIEGNSRLAAWRNLAARDPKLWNEVKCSVLPADTDQSLISAMLGQWHLKGKTKWPPYEQAGYLHRRHQENEIGVGELSKEVGLSALAIRQMIDAFEFMVSHEDNQRERWSYYYEYVKSRTIGKARKSFDKMDKVVVEQIKAEKIERAQDLRDHLPVVCKNEKVLRRYLRGDLNLTEAHELAVDLGGDHSALQRLHKFRMWLANEDVRDALSKTKGAVRDKIRFELSHIQKIIKKVNP